MRLCTANEARMMDSYTINVLGVPSITLMARASAHLAREAANIMGDASDAAVFCGCGNNGGDGIGAAIGLITAGKNVRVFLIGPREEMTPDTAEMTLQLESLGGKTEEYTSAGDISEYLDGCGVIIDAIYGFGFHLPLQGEAYEACKLINNSKAPVVAADLPSGVEADTGFASDGAVKADVTVTFSMAKIGHFITPGALYSGKVVVKDIGVSVPEDYTFENDVFAVTCHDVSLPKRDRDTHKGNFGRDLIIAGSKCYTGAPSFASRAAVRTGAGLVFLGVPWSIYHIEAVKNDESMVFPLLCNVSGRVSAFAAKKVSDTLFDCDACLVGPGLGIGTGVDKVVETVLTTAKCPVIVDADGITSVSMNINILDRTSCSVILTPHDGEFLRLGGKFEDKDRLTAARDFAAAHNVTLVLKGYRTICAFPDGSVFVNTTGNPGMAKGGSGDVLSGMILSLIGQGLELKKAVTFAVFLHGKAGDICAERFGEYSMTPSDVIDAISEVTR